METAGLIYLFSSRWGLEFYHELTPAEEADVQVLEEQRWDLLEQCRCRKEAS